MAGQPKMRALKAALDDLTREQFDGEPATHLDLAVAWLESGDTLVALARRAYKLAGLGDTFLPARLGQYLRSQWPDTLGDQSADVRLREARRIGAYAQAELTHDVAAETVGDSADAARARNRIGALQWSAERMNRELAANKAPAVSLNVSAGALHFSALTARNGAEGGAAGAPGASAFPNRTVSAALPAATAAATVGATDQAADVAEVL